MTSRARHHLILCDVLAALAGTAGVTRVQAQPAAPGFGQPTPSGIVGDGFEVDLRLDNHTSNEAVYSAAPVGTGSSSVIWRSLDAGKTFKYVASQIPPFGKPIPCVGGGDPELAVHPAGRPSYADPHLGNCALGRSDAHGA